MRSLFTYGFALVNQLTPPVISYFNHCSINPNLSMRILHTADWHLGQRFCDLDRKEEHDLFLRWLLKALKEHQPDALLVAGDVFDVGYPAKYAETQYYDFLKEAFLLCPNIIITGGNHDSPNALNAPRNLLSSFNIHVVGGAFANIEEEIIPVKDLNGNILGIVAAVPYLREGDVRTLQSGENYQDKIIAYKQGIKQHYRELCNASLPYKQQGIPIIATGHLYAAGSVLSDTEDKEMHIIGHQGQMEVEIFPPEFDYIALGHIHKPQMVNGNRHIRYSGSPIPLSFSERNDSKQVLLAEFEPHHGLTNIISLPVPLYRSLHRFKGSYESVIQQLGKFEHASALKSCWAEIHLLIETFNFNFEEPVKQLAKEKNIDILKFPNPKFITNPSEQNVEEPADLDFLENSTQVFLEKCKAGRVSEENLTELKYTFNELMEIMSLKESN
ncbi:MAG: exonuclease subunit SbcD [Sphingobacteriales bacterium]|nr:MAG: exonuclease subunit SbcD [Sphingobacteriales bacterium]